MKKFIFILIIILFSMPCMAYDSFVLMFDKDYTNVKTSNESVIKINRVQNINNNSKMMLITPQKEGSSIISLKKGRKNTDVKIKVTGDKTIIQHVNGVKVVPVNLPAELR